MHKITFFPLGNADCCRIDLANGRQILIDFAATGTDDKSDKRCDLPAALREDLQARRRLHYDVVAFTHLDKDHISGFSSFFNLHHAARYNGDGRVDIRELWVPAAILTETKPDDPEARILQTEARYRFRTGVGIRVFSRPNRLRDWCKQRGVDLDERMHLFSDAGTCVPGFNLQSDGMEFFVHSPLAVRQDERTVEDRNGDSLVLQGTFRVAGVDTRVLFLGDATRECIRDFVGVTSKRARGERLDWDVVKIPHHCSYLSIGSDKGEDRTEPIDEVKSLYEDHGQARGLLISTSKPIPVSGSAEDKDNNPPHRQAAGYYKKVGRMLGGSFLVTMTHPSGANPRPLVVEFSSKKACVLHPRTSAGATIVSARPPRAG